MLPRGIALFQFRYTLYQAFQHFLTFASNWKVCILSCLHEDELLNYGL